jgi:hypothetical protein
MDLANTLIRTVVRAFYETRQILIVDALCIHSVYVYFPSALKLSEAWRYMADIHLLYLM